MKPDEKERLRKRRHRRVRSKVSGTTARPRLNVSRSLQHIYVQLIDDEQGVTMASASTVEASVRSIMGSGGNMEAARSIGKLIAERALKIGIKAVVFDRGGYKYHGRVKALADSARQGGLAF